MPGVDRTLALGEPLKISEANNEQVLVAEDETVEGRVGVEVNTTVDDAVGNDEGVDAGVLEGVGDAV